MAKANKETVETYSEQESEYTAAEFAANTRALFGVSPDIVTAAFKVAGLDHASKSKADNIIQEFKKKEV